MFHIGQANTTSSSFEVTSSGVTFFDLQALELVYAWRIKYDSTTNASCIRLTIMERPH